MEHLHPGLILEKQPSGNVSPHFKYAEFTQSNFGEVRFNRLSEFLLKRLCLNILEPIRFTFGHGINISSGIRDINIMNGLRAAGYHPSATTDHSFGDPEYNPFGVGAADLVPIEGSCEELFLTAWELRNRNVHFGQLLWERQGQREWVHISNPKTVLFTNRVADFLKSRLTVGYGLNGKYYTDKPW